MYGFYELRNWMKKNRIGLREFALKAGIDKTTIWRLLDGRTRTCSLQLVDKLSKATGGAIGQDEVRAYERRQMRRRASVLSA